MSYLIGRGLEVLDKLPVASLQPVFLGNEKVEAEKSRAVVVEGQPVAFVSNHYTLVNHKDAFLEALNTMEVPLNDSTELAVYGKNGYASMRVMFDELMIDDGAEGIRMGFEIKNSIDKSACLGVEMKRKQQYDGTGGTVTFFGLRQICSNGMKIKVPIADASFSGKVKHMGSNLLLKFQDLLNLARASIPMVEDLIKKSMLENISKEDFAKKLGQMGFSDKNIKLILREFDDKKTIWEAYNSITFIASHKIKSQAVADKLTDKAWDLMETIKVKA